MKRVLYSTMGALALCAVAATAHAEHRFGPDALDTQFGAAFRLRQELWDNAFDLQDNKDPGDWNFFRLKSSVWAHFDYAKKFGLNAKLTNEARYYMQHPSAAQEDFHEDEIVFDNLYLTAKDFLGMPVDLAAGRMDFLFQYGDGFLIQDGTPDDGSRTFYFNAVKATVKFNASNSVDLVALSNTKYDDYLPSIHQSEKQRLNRSEETGFFAYFRSKITDNFTAEPYYIYKNEEEAAGKTGTAYTGKELDLHTVGARLVYTAGPYQIRGEYAFQEGDYDDTNVDREGHGGYVFANRTFTNVAFKPKFEIGFVNLSGDDPNTTDDEAFNPLFSRWPWMSELYVFTMTDERDIAYWTNLQIYRAQLWLNLTDKTKLDIAYNHLRADENTSSASVVRDTIFSHTDKDRGDLYQFKISHVLTKSIDTYLLIEYFEPGDFYKSTAQDDAIFGRWQVQLKF